MEAAVARERGPQLSMEDMSRLRSKIVKDEEVTSQDMIDWRIIAASRSPGPGEYTLKDEVEDRMRGGRFSKGNSKSEVDFIIYEASDKPGPADYTMPDVSDLMKGGRLNKGKAKGFLDWVEYTSKQIPAPHDHQPEGFDKSTRSPVPGGKFPTGARPGLVPAALPRGAAELLPLLLLRRYLQDRAGVGDLPSLADTRPPGL